MGTDAQATSMRGFVIALKAVPASLRMGQKCLAAGRRHGWDMELFDAFHGLAGRDWLQQRGYPLLQPGAPHYNDTLFMQNHACRDGRPGTLMTPGMMGSIASHTALWELCLELGQPIAIFEHDAQPTAAPPQADFEHCLVLGPEPQIMTDHGTLVQPIDPAGAAVQPLHFLLHNRQGRRCLPLAACYALSPAGAAAMLADTRRWGGAPIDVQVRHGVVNLQVLARPVCTFQEGYRYNPSLTNDKSERFLGGSTWRWNLRRLVFAMRGLSRPLRRALGLPVKSDRNRQKRPDA